MLQQTAYAVLIFSEYATGKCYLGLALHRRQFFFFFLIRSFCHETTHSTEHNSKLERTEEVSTLLMSVARRADKNIGQLGDRVQTQWAGVHASPEYAVSLASCVCSSVP